MKIKHKEIIIDKKDPFLNCKLNRSVYANVLTGIVSSYADGFVLAINNEWGTGKTTFVKMWRQYLVCEDFQTLYFNAWENDFESNPLVAIMSELKTLKNRDNDEKYKSLLEKGAILTKNIFPALVKGLTKKYINTEEIAELFENMSKAATEILEKDIEEYAKRKKHLVEFREELKFFLKELNSDKPLVFIIDELDRCKPNYAVEVLEQIKHFFSVEGIVFVLSIDKVQLGHAIRGVYGSEQLNSEEYLKRFIDLEFSLPQPESKDFCRYLYEYYSFDSVFSSLERNNRFGNEGNLLISVATILFDKLRPTLRQQEKIWALTRVVVSTFPITLPMYTNVLFTLIFIKSFQNDLYKRIETNDIDLQELSTEFYKLLPKDFEKYYSANLVYLEAMLLDFYNNQQDQSVRKILFTKNGDNIDTYIKSKIEFDNIKLGNCLYNISREIKYDSRNLIHLIERINLTQQFAVPHMHD